MSDEQPPEVIEVPVKRVEVKITLDDVLDALSKHVATMAPEPQVAERLQRLSQLAAEMKGVVTEVAQLDPTVHDQLQRGGSGGSG